MNTLKLDFAEWLKQEMTSASSVGGGSTSTADIARFSRPLLTEPVRRKMPKILNSEAEKKK
jgi:hypothetical protein